MKKTIFFLAAAASLALMLSSFTYNGSAGPAAPNVPDTSVYRDGTWVGSSRASYTDEPYWGIARITTRKGKITKISFVVRDSSLHETFNAAYEKHFEGNPDYIQQSRNDWHGVQTYPGLLMKKQDIRKVDAMTGATWSYNIFRASVEDALKKAR